MNALQTVPAFEKRQQRQAEFLPWAKRKRLRIAYIGSRGFPGFSAGVEKSLEEICPRLALRGHEITLYCSAKVATRESLYKGTILRRTPAIFTKHLETITRTMISAADAAFRGYDIVHFHSIGPALLSWMTRLGGSKTVVTVHGLDWQRAKWGRLARLSLQAGERSSVFFPHQTIVVSKQLEKHCRDRYARDIVFIPNGVTMKEPRRPRLIADKWGLSAGDYLLFASRLVPEKDCHTLIGAFRKLKTEKKLLIAGSSWHSDGYTRELYQQASGDKRIIFAGWAEGEMLEELFSNAYLYCLPSQIEGLSLSLLEAMSYGLCPVVSDIPENTDVTGPCGAAFRTGDAADLTRKLQELLAQPEKVYRLGAGARELVQQNYSWDTHVDRLEEAYLNLAAKDAQDAAGPTVRA